MQNAVFSSSGRSTFSPLETFQGLSRAIGGFFGGWGMVMKLGAQSAWFAMRALFAGLLLVSWPLTVRAQSDPPRESGKKAPAVPDYGLPQVKRINEEMRRVWADN